MNDSNSKNQKLKMLRSMNDSNSNNMDVA